MTLDERFTAPSGWQWRNNFVTRAGQHVRYGWVSPANARALVVVLPGLSEYVEKYFEVGRDLVARGFAVACIDWRGQGLSWRQDDPTRRYHDDFANDIADACAFIDALGFANGLPRIMLAHSMGGNIGLHVLHERPDAFRCAVMTAPLFGLAIPEMPALFLAGLLSKLGFSGAYLPGNGAWRADQFNRNLDILTSDPQRRALQAHWMSRAELRMGGLTYGWLKAALASIRKLRRPGYLNAISTPCLFVQAGRERIVSNAAIDLIAARLPRAETVHIPEALHEIMMEQDVYRSRFWQAFDGFVAKHLREG